MQKGSEHDTNERRITNDSTIKLQMMLSVAQRAYLAGLIDGEGSIYIAKTKRWRKGTMGYQLRMSIAMTHKPTISWVKKVLDGGFMKTEYQKNQNHLTLYRWLICDDRAVEVLKLVRPYLITKQRNAQIGIEFRRQCFVKPRYLGNDLEQITKKRDKFYRSMNRTILDKTNSGIAHMKADKDKKSQHGY